MINFYRSWFKLIFYELRDSAVFRPEKFPGAPMEKRLKITKKYRKIALFSLFRGSQQKKNEYQKQAENSTFKPLSTIFVPCMKIHGRSTAPLPPAADAHDGILRILLQFECWSLPTTVIYKMNASQSS